MIADNDAVKMAALIQDLVCSASGVVEESLLQTQRDHGVYNLTTNLLPDRARQEARLAAGPLAGVPYLVKNLFDVAGIVTLAGSQIDAENPPATSDATLVQRLQAAGACLLGTTNMDEYAYGFSTENTTYGATRNPRNPACIAGGSSGGSAAAVASGCVPFSLGSDTNGSIRVPASLCGIYGLKPTYGRLSRAGTRPFVASLDHVGPFARSARDLALLMDVLDGPDAEDPVCTSVRYPKISPQLSEPWTPVRAAILGGYFQRWSSPEADAAVEKAGRAFQAVGPVEIAGVDQARSAAYLITAMESANLHLSNLKKRPLDFDPLVRDRFLAGALMPATHYLQAQRYRSVFKKEMQRAFEEFDLLIVPATPISAPEIGQKFADFKGQKLIARHCLGLYTQPISLVGLPALSVPIIPEGKMPLGVMLIGRPHSEALLIRAALYLEKLGLVTAHA